MTQDVCSGDSREGPPSLSDVSDVDLPDLPLCCRAVLKETNKGKTSVSNYRELRLYFHKQHFNIIQIKPINFTIYCTILELLSLSPSLYIRLRLETRFICMDLLLQPVIVYESFFKQRVFFMYIVPHLL